MTTKNNKTNDLTYSDIAKMARNNAADFAQIVIGEKPTYRGNSEIRFLKNQSLVVYTRGNRQGFFQSFSDESAKGDMLDFCQYIRGMNKHEALLLAKDILNITDSDLEHAPSLLKSKSPEERDREAEEIKQKKIRTAQWIWENSSPEDGKAEGEEYLKNRGLKGPFDPNLIRYKRLSEDDLLKMNVPKNHIPKTPVVSVVFKATNAKGEITAVQQVITTQGKKITNVIPEFENPKRTNGYLTGSAVKFGGETPDKVILAEGPETALSLFESTKIPTWITLGTSNYTTLQLPKTVKETIVAADMEPSGVGLGAALRAAQHWTRAGVPKVGIALPRTQEGDFNDILQQKGPQSVKKMVDTTFYGAKPRALDTVLVTPDARAAFHVWQKSGIETRVRVPGKTKDGKRFPIALDSMIEDHHKHVLLIQKDGFTILDQQLKKNRPDVTIEIVSENSEDFLEKAKKPDYVEKTISYAVDMFAPTGRGNKEPVAFCLRRADAEALHEAGHKVIAVRSTALDRINFDFMKNRKSYICPIGNGTPEDQKLAQKLKAAGSDITVLKWQTFKPENDGYKIVRKTIPETYSAKDAVAEGWKGEAMKHLINISKNNEAEQQNNNTKNHTPKNKQQKTR